MSKIISEQERRNVWLSFASAAISGLGANPKKKFEAIIEDSSDLANAMLEEYLIEFEPGYEPEEEEEEEDEEDEDEDEDERPAKRRARR